MSVSSSFRAFKEAGDDMERQIIICFLKTATMRGTRNKYIDDTKKYVQHTQYVYVGTKNFSRNRV